mgnify:FL=1
MTVFKTFWKVVNKYKGTFIMYTIMLIVFGSMNTLSNKDNNVYVDSKPDILIVNNDEEIGITRNLINYLKENSNIVNIKDTEEARNDALFYRDVSYIIYIPKNYRSDVLKGNNPEIDIKTNNTYDSSFTEIMLTRYINIQNVYAKYIDNEEELINVINSNLVNHTNTIMTSKIDTNNLTRLSRFFNFASYSIMAVVIFIICLTLTSFKEDNIRKRITISSMPYTKHNRQILLASLIYSLIVWIIYVILGIIIFNKEMFTIRGLIFSINTLIFCFCALTLALLISSSVNNKNAITGIVNVVALGQAFLCGAFIPTEFMPSSVLKMAHILPAYWYNNTNDLLSSINEINISSLKPILINSGVLILFSLVFIVINNLVTKKKQVF